MAIKTPTAPRKLRKAERQLEVLVLRRRGMNYRAIGRQLGCSRTTVMRDLREQLEILATETEQSRDSLRTLELERLDELIRVHSLAAEAGDEKAAGLILRCIAERSKLLGLYASQRVELSGDADAPIKHEHDHVHAIATLTDKELRSLVERGTTPNQNESSCQPQPPAQTPAPTASAPPAAKPAKLPALPF